MKDMKIKDKKDEDKGKTCPLTLCKCPGNYLLFGILIILLLIFILEIFK